MGITKSNISTHKIPDELLLSKQVRDIIKYELYHRNAY